MYPVLTNTVKGVLELRGSRHFEFITLTSRTSLVACGGKKCITVLGLVIYLDYGVFQLTPKFWLHHCRRTGSPSWRGDPLRTRVLSKSLRHNENIILKSCFLLSSGVTLVHQYYNKYKHHSSLKPSLLCCLWIFMAGGIEQNSGPYPVFCYILEKINLFTFYWSLVCFYFNYHLWFC